MLKAIKLIDNPVGMTQNMVHNYNGFVYDDISSTEKAQGTQIDEMSTPRSGFYRPRPSRISEMPIQLG